MDSFKIRPFYWEEGQLFLLDQRLLPEEEVYLKVDSPEGCYQAIRDMVVRGAPLIGQTALFGLVFWFRGNPDGGPEDFFTIVEFMKTARPTAVNLAFEVDMAGSRGEAYFREHSSFKNFDRVLYDYAMNRVSLLSRDNCRIACLGEEAVNAHVDEHKQLNLMTLCNTGALACGCRGTALGIIQYLGERKRVNMVYPSETRPYLQGSRLTSYELLKYKIPHRIVVEGAFDYLLSRGMVDAVFVGADRIALNGDTANKIGTATLSIVARHYGVPFFVAAPTSSFDMTLKSGQEIPVEIRPEEEILSFRGMPVAPEKARALNPAFDLTPGENITAIICEKGIISPVTPENLRDVVKPD